MVTTKVTLGQLADSILALCEAKGIDIGQLRNVVNAELGQCAHDGDTEVKAKASIKPGKGDKPEVFKLSERQLNKFEMKGIRPALRFYFWNQEMQRLEQVTGIIPMNAFPDNLAMFAVKFVKVPAAG